MNITLKTEYALRSLGELVNTGTGQPVTRKQIARNQGISEHFLEKIFIDLQKKRIIRSMRGPGGGFVLNRSIEDISLWDVYSAVDNPGYEDHRCYRKDWQECDHRQGCKVRPVWFKFSRRLRETMSEIKLGDIVRR